MTKSQALHAFFASFSIPAYEENSVPTGSNLPSFPYLTYEQKSDNILGGKTPIAVNIYYRESTWANCNSKTEEFSSAIGMGGKIVSCDGGAIWIHRGAPFAQSVADPGDDMIKRKYITLSAEFLTAD